MLEISDYGSGETVAQFLFDGDVVDVELRCTITATSMEIEERGADICSQGAFFLKSPRRSCWV